MACWNSPRASGDASWDSVDRPPADSPNTVTLRGLPPNAADVALHPAQRGLLVHQPVVAGRPARPAGQRAVGQEAERAEPVVDGDHDHAVLDQGGRVVVVALAGHQGATVDPHHDRPVAPGGARRGVDVQVQAVLGGAGHAEGRGRLRAVRREAGRGAHARPPRGRLRRLPAQVPDRRRRVRDAEELAGPRGRGAAQQPAGGGHHRAAALPAAPWRYSRHWRRWPRCPPLRSRPGPRRPCLRPGSAAGSSASRHPLCASNHSVRGRVLPPLTLKEPTRTLKASVRI